MKPKLYLEEGIHGRLAQALRERGLDAQGFGEAGRMGYSDADQLAHAVSERRAIVTYDLRHFQELAIIYLVEEKDHWGIVISPQYELGEMLRRLIRLCDTYTAEQLRNQIVYLQMMG